MDVNAPDLSSPTLSDNENDNNELSPLKAQDTDDEAAPPKIKLLELPVEVLANIANHMDKRELVRFGSLCKQARIIASRYLFACISLGKLESIKLQTCFETLHQDQLSLIRKFNVSLQLPVSATDKSEDRIRSKWLSVLLDLVGRSFKNLDIHVNLAPSTPRVNPLDQSPLQSLTLLSQAAESYSLYLDFTKWKEAGRSSSRFWPVFSHSLLSSLPTTKDIRMVTIAKFDSHFGKLSADGNDDEDHLLDFIVPSQIEKDLIEQLQAMKEVTDLRLKGCNLSSHFNVPYAFNLVVLELDFEGIPSCMHTMNLKVALSLITANREVLRDLSIKGWYPSEEDADGVIDLLSLRTFNANLAGLCCSDLPPKAFHSPNLTSLVLKSACLHDPVTTLTDAMMRLPKLECLELETDELLDGECEDVTQLCKMYRTQGLVLKLAWPVPSLPNGLGIWHGLSHIEGLEQCITKFAFRLSAGCIEDMPAYVMSNLQYLSLSFSFTWMDVTTKDVNCWGLPCEHLINFFGNLDAPILETLDINFTSPFIDYLQPFARYIGSGAFSRNFPVCKEIKGSITADTHNTWDRDAHYGKTASNWLKEMFVKACKEYHLDISDLQWTNARLVT